jgi:hypothetical protein
MHFKYFPLLLSITLLFTISCRPACPIASCQVRKVHHHGKSVYRGQPIWKKQNPSIGERLPKAPTDDQGSQRKGNKKQ